MASADFPSAPDAGNAFEHASQGAPPPRDMPEPVTERPVEVDHLDLATWDYTPGGALEYEVHKELSDNARRQYQEQLRQEAPSDEKHYLDHLGPEFDQAARATSPGKEDDGLDSSQTPQDRPPQGPDRSGGAAVEKASRFQRSPDHERTH